MNNDLKILITANLNIGKSIGDINTQIKGLEKKVNALKIKVDIDDKVLQKLDNFGKQMKRMSESALNPNKVIEEVLNPDGSKIKRTFLNGLEGAFEQIEKKAREVGKTQLKSQDEVSDGYDKLIKKVERYNAAQKKVGSTVTLSDDQGINSKTINLNNKDKVIGYTDTYDANKASKLKEQELKEEQKLINQMASAREKANQKRFQDEQKLAENQAKAANKNIELIHKEKLAQEELNKKHSEEINKLQDKVKLYQEDRKIKVSGLVNSYGNNVNNAALEKYMDGLKNIPLDNVDLANKKMAELNLAYKGLSTNARIASKDSLAFGDMLSQAMTKFPIWMIASTA